MNMFWLDLLNSDWHDYKGGGRHEDRLDNYDWLRKFLQHWGELQINPEDPATREKLRNLRTLIRAMADDFMTGKKINENDLESLNSILESSLSISRLEAKGKAYSLRQVPRERGLAFILAEIASSFADVIARGESERLKICENRDCLWIFYDESKNRSRKWCEGGTGCGNLMKVRRFRERKKNRGSK
jgi:predicted RNA-binding Zn ribbon-like protein